MKDFSLKNISNYLFLFGLFLLACSLPFSNLFMSLSQIIMLGSFLLSGNLSEKIKLFAKNKIALVVCSLFIMHIIGLIYTSDFNYGMEDIRKKIPLLLLPFLFATAQPLPKGVFEKVLVAFTIAVSIASFICFYVLLGYTNRQILQPQSASIFISHIRFALLISLSIFILGYFFAEKKSWAFKIIVVLLIIWFILFLIMMGSATGVICISGTCVILLCVAIARMKNRVITFIVVALCIVGIIFFSKYLFAVKNNFNQVSKINYKQLPALTKNGNTYSHDTSNTETENGNRVWLFYCEKEVSDEWNKRSHINYYKKDLRSNNIKFTIVRFLTSKQLPKDSEGVRALTQKEIEAIEKGIPNVNYMGLFNPMVRFRKIFWEFDMYLRGENPSGHSVIQRLEFWKAAVGIIKENPLIGVGTGDVKNTFEEQYKKMKSPLTKEWRLRSHNQFLAIGTAFGIIGIIWFLFTLFFPFYYQQKPISLLYLIFFVIAFLSMFAEDTLESQAGVTFFAFFNSFFLFLKKDSA